MITFAQVIALIIVMVLGGIFIAAARGLQDRPEPEQRPKQPEPRDWNDDDLETQWRPRSGGDGEETFEFTAGSVNLKWSKKR